MTTTLTTFPASLVAGDSLAVEWSASDYPRNGGWTATAALAGASVAGPFTGGVVATDATAHRFSVSAATTAALAAGTYSWRIRVTNGTTTTTAATGRLTVTPDVGNAAAGELVSYDETLLPLVEAAITTATTAGVARMKFGNPSHEAEYDLPALLKLRAKLIATIEASRGYGFGRAVRYNVVMS